jgi:hypothetical protein
MWNDLVPIAGMATGVLLTGMLTWGFVSVFRGPVGQAISRRISGGHDDHLEEEVLELRDAVAGLSDELREMQERVDFAERLLTEGDAARPLVSGDSGLTTGEGATHG